MDILGIDIGFGFTKATNGKDSIIFKSIFGEAAQIQFRDQLLDQAGPESYLHLEIDGTPYFVGELAERQSNVCSFTLDHSQFVESFAKTMALGAMASLMPESASVRIVTGLPVGYYQNQRDRLAGILRGRHDLVHINAKGKRRELAINVVQVRVIPQPFGTLLDNMLSEVVEISDKRFAQGKVGVIDVGFRTSDYTIADATKYSERGSHTTDSGIAQGFALIANKLREATGVNVELYRLYDAVARGSIKIRGKTIDLTKLTEEVFTKLASAIATEVDRLWSEDWDVDLIVITGGGGAVLAPYLQPLLQGEVLTVDTTKDLRLQNVRGYWKYAKHLWGRAQQTPAAPPAEV
uniref:Plasmid segregation protein ParM n=1 Tax=Candidatus Kentrum sp. FM TaxID=2126340 RepID=A0A450TXW7_9GAMM|nr:MAG: plasmid segregation protein ParM [Candidatus Kentron sp. FM]VFJ74159.1 MAG: plasmid segregation protein ParM [Candidatus Kentron sp. FM]VFK07241.1 MAG: plasmid segregation protein ParM [Candidatus Kentron sp. FM]